MIASGHLTRSSVSRWSCTVWGRCAATIAASASAVRVRPSDPPLSQMTHSAWRRQSHDFRLLGDEAL